MTQLVRIPAGETPLSKAQKEFNRLAKKISELETELADYRTAADRIQQRVHADYDPLVKSVNDERAKLVRVFDRAHDRPEATKTERKKLVDIILNVSYELISEHGYDELKPIFDKYDESGFDAANAEADGQISEAMKDVVSSMYGIEFPDDVDVSTKEKFMAYFEEQMQARQADAQQQEQQRSKQQAKRPKSAKKQARDEKKQQDERNITKAVRTLYLDLVKAFHPDREPDEAEKLRKTEIMTRVTQAYEKGDLLALLRLQLEFNRIDQQHLETLADEQLKYYNRILKQQVEELSHELIGMQHQVASLLQASPMLVRSASMMEFSFNNEIREMKQRLKTIRAEVKALTDPATMKAFLKTYTIQKADVSDAGYRFEGLFG